MQKTEEDVAYLCSLELQQQGWNSRCVKDLSHTAKSRQRCLSPHVKRFSLLQKPVWTSIQNHTSAREQEGFWSSYPTNGWWFLWYPEITSLPFPTPGFRRF